MVVRLDLEDCCEPVADVNGAGILARSLQHLGPFGRERFQVDARALVTAVLGPHHREQAELGEVGLAAEELQDAIVLVRLQLVTFENLRIDHAPATSAPALSDCTTDSKMSNPSALPSGDSHARSGCGISPTTLRVSLQMPAIADTDPFGFASSRSSPSALVYRKMTCRFASSRAITSGSAK